MSSSEDDSYGPPLPPTMRSPGTDNKKGKADRKQDNKSDEEEDDAYMPALPPHMLKSLPKENYREGHREGKSKALEPGNKHREGEREVELRNKHREGEREVEPRNKHKEREDEMEAITEHKEEKQRGGENEPLDSDSESEMYGPAPPPHLTKTKDTTTPSSVCSSSGGRSGSSSSSSSRKRVVGPMLPKGYVPPEDDLKEGEKEEEEEEEEEDMEEEEEEEYGASMIGPSPPTQDFDQDQYRVSQLELRAKRMKDRLEGKDIDKKEIVVRESWMLELPSDKTKFCGLAPRTFLRKTPREKGDRSVWTDTPADRARKETEMKAQEDLEGPEVSASTQREKDLKDQVDKYNSNKRDKPLVDMHRKKMKIKEEASGVKERRPFSREEDLSVNKFDEAQKTNILKKARQLNDRFSSGGHKFL